MQEATAVTNKAEKPQTVKTFTQESQSVKSTLLAVRHEPVNYNLAGENKKREDQKGHQTFGTKVTDTPCMEEMRCHTHRRSWKRRDARRFRSGAVVRHRSLPSQIPENSPKVNRG